MDCSARRSAQGVAILLIATVVTQILYITLSDAGVDFSRTAIWTTEAVAFLGIAILALVGLARAGSHPAVWAAVALSGALNVIQVGMGLAMFGPLSEAGEAMAPAFQAILAGAFFLYFSGKFLFGLAAVLLGLDAVKDASIVAKIVGGLGVLAGLAALATNLAAMAGYELMFQAGGAGTAATLFLALLIGRAVAPDVSPGD